MIYDNELGGYFIHIGGIHKIMSCQFSKKNMFPKFSNASNNFYHFSFQSHPSRFSNVIERPQYLTFDLNMNSIKEIIINSQATLVPMNVIILVNYLTKYNLGHLKIIISRAFEDNIKLINILCDVSI